MTVCLRAGCPALVERGYCDTHRPKDPRRRDFNYSDRKWRMTRAKFLKANPTCVDCGAPATDADHAPVGRKQLLARGEPHPDAWSHLQARCHSCHSRRTNAGGGGASRTAGV